MDLRVIFLTGLFGGVSCMALQGGLFASLLLTQTDHAKNWRTTARLVVLFVMGKTVVYTLSGFLLGVLGSYIQMTLLFRIIMMIATSLFMLMTAGTFLNLHPVFRYFAIQPPRFFYTLARKESRQFMWYSPLLVGVLTVFLSCGTTQAMMVTALQFGNPFQSASVLFVFTVGTIPAFLVLGVFMHAASQVFTKYFRYITGCILVFLSLWNLSNVAALTGFDQRVQKLIQPLYCEIVYCGDAVNTQMKQPATTTPVITMDETAYIVDNPYLQAGSDIHLVIKNIHGGGCIQFFTIPQLGIEQIVPVGQEAEITFRAPSEPGVLPFMCSMGMYRGAFIVQ